MLHVHEAFQRDKYCTITRGRTGLIAVACRSLRALADALQQPASCTPTQKPVRSRARANQIQCWPAPCGHIQAAPCPPWLCARPPEPIRAFLHSYAGMHEQARPRAGTQCTRSRGPKTCAPRLRMLAAFGTRAQVT